MTDDKTHGFSTRAIHHGYDPMSADGALTPPLHLTSTFAFETAEQGGARFAGEAPGHIYTRISNPTTELLEQRMASLEGGEAAVAMASGMGAISSVLWSVLRAGDELITDKTLYGCTFSFFQHGLSRFGVTVTHVDLTNPLALETARERLAPLEETIGKQRGNDGPYFNGEKFSLVDASYGPFFQRFAISEKVLCTGLLDEFPVVKAWSDALLADDKVTGAVPDGFDEAFLKNLERRGALAWKMMSAGAAA